MTLRQKGFITIGAIIIALFSMPFASSIWIKSSTAKVIHETIEEVEPSEIAVVLGAAAWNPHTISHILQDRLDTAVELYESKKVKKLLLTGAENEVVAMKNYLGEKGVPDTAVLEDKNGFNTLASIQNIPKDQRDIVIVTQKFHLPRALFYAKHLGLNAVGVTADRRDYAKIYDFKKREILANTKAMFDVFVTSDFNDLIKDF